ncbi:Deuterolysin metalloprotease family-domain-containing protein [Favolaschia claudopus]|uniref:Neutral protease 2 n=1 Tax=Favolaschia claudopus TaxID=2862362 RepID=A0AAW0CUG2_9AGAR
MFFATFLTLAFAFASTAVADPNKRTTDSLPVEPSAAANTFNSVTDLILTATVSNNGAESIKVLKYGTILDGDLPTRSFTVTRDDKEVDFTGIKISVSLEDADESAYVTIPAGESVAVTHDVSALFDFAAAGKGAFTFTPIITFQSVPLDEKVAARSQLTAIEAVSTPITISITGDVAKVDMLSSRATDICTTASKKSFIDASYTEAKSLASIASSYVTSRGSSDYLYRAYWGSTATSRVISILNAVANENSSSRTLSCVDTFNFCSSGILAYTVTDTTNIYYCSIFFNQVATSELCHRTSVASRNVRGGTTLHELTHATSGTADFAYGCPDDQALSDSKKIQNADNFNCFTTQVYASTRC